MRKTYFVGIGISKYKNLSELPDAVKDMNGIWNVLSHKYHFKSSDCFILKDEKASLKEITKLFEKLIKKFQKYASKGIKVDLLIYFSGHGHFDEVTQYGYWMPHDAEKGSSHTFFWNNKIISFIRNIRSHHTLLISDSCFSGSLVIKPLIRKSVSRMERLNERKSRWVFCSSLDTEVSYDGIFASCILEVLEKNTAEYLTAHDFVGLVKKSLDEKNSAYEYDYRYRKDLYQDESEIYQIDFPNPIYRPILGYRDTGGEFVFKNKFYREDEERKKKTIINPPNPVVPIAQPRTLFAQPKVNEPKPFKFEALKKRLRQLMLFLIGIVVIVGSWLIKIKTDHPVLITEKGEQYRIFVDGSGDEWMGENLRTKEVLYFDVKGGTETSGLLYTWESAMKACPKGWHLPSDKEWDKLIIWNGGSAKDSFDADNADGYNQLLKGGISGFDAELTGIGIGNGIIRSQGAKGSYWTSTPKKSVGTKKMAKTIDFNKEHQEIISTSHDQSEGLSCRCKKSKKGNR